MRFILSGLALTLFTVACSSSGGGQPTPTATPDARMVSGVFGCPSPPLASEAVPACTASHSLTNYYELTLPRHGSGAVTGTGMVDGTLKLVSPENPTGGCMSRTQIKLRISGKYDGAQTITGTLAIDTIPLAGTCPEPLGSPTHQDRPLTLHVAGDTITGSSGVLFFTPVPAAPPQAAPP
ncbi:MAG TPA: hypothetical protein VEZ14_08250 [Dehalococcoidia bacterium]|nr:hypothetical protein [Dehalococcoidia bacterium]